MSFLSTVSDDVLKKLVEGYIQSPLAIISQLDSKNVIVKHANITFNEKLSYAKFRQEFFHLSIALQQFMSLLSIVHHHTKLPKLSLFFKSDLFEKIGASGDFKDQLISIRKNLEKFAKNESIMRQYVLFDLAYDEKYLLQRVNSCIRKIEEMS